MRPKLFLFAAALAATFVYTSCEDESILSLDPWHEQKPCAVLQGTVDYIGQIDFYPQAQQSLIHIHDWAFPDFGENQYYAIVQYKDAAGVAHCAAFVEVAPFRFVIPAAFLNEARITFKRQTWGEDGDLWMQVDSRYYYFTNNIYTP
jgi:hypothetical protein